MKIKIKADTNDADYIEKVSSISEEELDKIRPLIKAIKKFKPYKSKVDGRDWSHHHNYSYGECLREDLGEKSPRELYKGIDKEAFEIFEELCPYDEYGFHTVESIEVWPDVPVEKLL